MIRIGARAIKGEWAIRYVTLPTALVIIGCLTLIASGYVSATGGTLAIVSIDSSGVQSNSVSSYSAISADGRYVAFQSWASNLVPADSNGDYDIFVRDLQAGTTERVSVDSDGSEANGSSMFPDISADGRFVAFKSAASNLVAGDMNGVDDVFVHDRATGATTRVSVDSGGSEANGWSGSWVDISDDGQVVAFGSTATNIVPGDTSSDVEPFVHDRVSGSTERVAVSSGGTPGNYGGASPSLSEDGRYVAFASESSNLVPGDTNLSRDIFVRDRLADLTEMLSITSTGGLANGNSTEPDITPDGRYIAFQSFASNLSQGDSNNKADAFVRDRQAGITLIGSLSSTGALGNGQSGRQKISSDGRVLTFESSATNLVPGDSNGMPDIFARYLQSGLTVRVSGLGGLQANDWSIYSAFSSDGSFVSFMSGADNLVPGDTNLQPDIFVRELSDDTDEDGVIDRLDNCGAIQNAGQQNSDADGRGDACDNCPSVTNSDQADADGDGVGDACQDSDGDGVFDINDNCVGASNPGQGNSDADGLGDACDNCPTTDNQDQANTDGDAMGDACDPDDDNDGVLDGPDNCPLVFNPGQEDRDQDSAGDACDPPCTGASFCVEVLPAEPVSSDFVQIRVTGDLPDTCHTASSSYSRAGSSITVSVQVANTAPPGTSCAQIVEQFTVVEDAGLLAAGSYRMDSSYYHPWCNPSPCTQSTLFNVLADTDSDGASDIVDNCPTTPNADQRNTDGDSLGDACDPDYDNDGVTDAVEPPCGADPLDLTPPFSRPERLDLPGDDDGDTLVDEPLPAGAEPFDCDGDGYSGAAEAHVFTATNALDQDPCGTTAWPSDFVSGGIPDSTNIVNILDLTSFLAPTRHLNTSPPEPEYADRWDLVPGAGAFAEVINVTDLTALIAGSSGNPPMLAGAKAFNGPSCPWAP